MVKKRVLSNDQKVEILSQRLAGEKLEKVQKAATELEAQGKTKNRALADALEQHKCPNSPRDYDS